jgi:hypothetical protein
VKDRSYFWSNMMHINGLISNKANTDKNKKSWS